MMQLRYDEDFIEAAVFLCASGRRPGVPRLQVTRFHHEREMLYCILDPDERNAAFFKLHLDWFREWGLEAVFTSLLKEYPLLSTSLDTFAVRRTRGKDDEGAELFVNEAGQRNAVVALRPERFEDESRLRDVLRHEFMHLSDMVDPAFGYSPDLPALAPVAAPQRLVRDRYRLLWDTAIDGRLAAAGHVPAKSRDQHAAAFSTAYSFWPPDRQSAVFESLWSNPTPHHSDLLALVSDPRGVRDAQRPVPGALCPLCGFPTFKWAEAEVMTSNTVARIKMGFPSWSPEQGLCGRCLETYEAAAQYAGGGVSLPREPDSGGQP